MRNTAEYYIQELGLKRHPEGGYYREIYRSSEIINLSALPHAYSGNRNIATAIYFLIEKNDISRFHRLKSDEIWCHLEGGSVRIYLLDPLGKLSEIDLGKNLESGEILQFVIPKGYWFAAEVLDKKSFALISCIVSPGFDFKDFELGSREELSEKYPVHKELVEMFT